MDKIQKTINLIFDGNIFANELEKNSNRSGIFFVAYNLIKEFSQKENINITLYYNYKNYHKLKLLLDTNKLPDKCKLLPKNKKFNHISKIQIGFCGILNQILQFAANSQQDNLLKKALRFFVYRIFRYNQLTNIDLLTDNDIYFSACDKIPEKILNNQRIKSYQILHDVIPIIMEKEYKGFNSPLLWMQELIDSLRTQNKYFTVSEHTKKDVLKCAPWMLEENFIITYLGANDNFKPEGNQNKIREIKTKYNIPQDKKYVFSLCTLEPRKNIIFAVKNFLSFIKDNGINDLVIALGGASWKKFIQVLEEEFDNLQEYKEYIIKLGYVDDEDLNILYSGAELFVYPSLYEGFGLPILEAMQCGCPVICSNTTSMPEVIGNAGIQINPNSEKELIEAYKKLYYDTDYKQTCVKLGLERAKQFSWEKCANIMVEQFMKDLS